MMANVKGMTFMFLCVKYVLSSLHALSNSDNNLMRKELLSHPCFIHEKVEVGRCAVTCSR